MTPRTWQLTVPLPVWTINAQRRMHYHQHGNLTREYRATTALIARAAHIPHLERVAIEATPSGPKIRQDVGACYHTVKAAIDGLVDAHILDNDTPDIVPTITMHAPIRGDHALHLSIIELDELDGK